MSCSTDKTVYSSFINTLNSCLNTWVYLKMWKCKSTLVVLLYQRIVFFWFVLALCKFYIVFFSNSKEKFNGNFYWIFIPFVKWFWEIVILCFPVQVHTYFFIYPSFLLGLIKFLILHVVSKNILFNQLIDILYFCRFYKWSASPYPYLYIGGILENDWYFCI